MIQKLQRVIGVLVLTVVLAFSFHAPSFADTANELTVNGKDIAYVSLPLIVNQNAQFSTENTWGRVVRLAGSGQFYDFGIDQEGNFFINTPNDTKTSHTVTITPKGVVTIK